MNLAFISSPYKAVLDNAKNANLTIQQAHETALQFAKTASKWAIDKGYIPIAPVLLFDGILTENEREQITQMCVNLVKKCEVFVFCDTPFTQDSEGMAYELDIAELNHKCVENLQFVTPYKCV